MEMGFVRLMRTESRMRKGATQLCIRDSERLGSPGANDVLEMAGSIRSWVAPVFVVVEGVHIAEFAEFCNVFTHLQRRYNHVSKRPTSS